MEDSMQLIDSAGVCEMLGISKSTLYRWCGVSDQDSVNIKVKSPFDQIVASRDLDVSKNSRFTSITSKYSNTNPFTTEDESFSPIGFPKPFKIGKAYKWDKQELIVWVRSNRIK